MEKLYTEEEYSDKAYEANQENKKLYVYTHTVDYEATVLEYEYKEEEQEQQVYDEEGNPVYDEEGNPVYEKVIVQVPYPIMETVTEPNPRAGETHIEIDPETGEEIEVVEPDTITYERQKFHYETRTKEVAELVIAEEGYYICYEENYTDGTINADLDKEKARKEAERIANLHMSKREMFLGLRKARNIMPEQIRAQIQDPDAQIEFDYATEYFRGNPLIDIVGAQLGFTTKQLDRFFETKDYKELLNEDTTDKQPTVPDEVPPEGV